MSIAQAAALRTHLQNLTTSGAAITAYPDAEELVLNWGATTYDVADLVRAVRQGCPPGYIIPFVCKWTDMRVIMAHGNGQWFTHALLATAASMSYCKTRLRNVARDFRNMAAGFPAGTPFRVSTENFCSVVEAFTAPGYGPLSIAITQLPMLARRASAAERALLTSEAARYAA